MAIKSELFYDCKTDSIFGFGDLGSIGITKDIGKQALVFMAPGMLSSWKQPLGYFVSGDSTTANILHTLLLECLS